MSHSVESSQKDEEEEETLNVVGTETENKLILDSGSTCHMCPHESWFITFEKEDAPTVILGNNQTYEVKGDGSVRLRNHLEKVKVLTDAGYIPDFKRNFISLGMLKEKGYMIVLM